MTVACWTVASSDGAISYNNPCCCFVVARLFRLLKLSESIHTYSTATTLCPVAGIIQQLSHLVRQGSLTKQVMSCCQKCKSCRW